jgi:hypothetical protein
VHGAVARLAVKTQRLALETGVGRRMDTACTRQRHVLAAPAKGIISVEEGRRRHCDSGSASSGRCACMIHEPIDRELPAGGAGAFAVKIRRRQH